MSPASSFFENLSRIIGRRCIFLRSISSSSDQILLGSDLALVCRFDCESQYHSVASVLNSLCSLSTTDCHFPQLLFCDSSRLSNLLVISWLSGDHLLRSQLDLAFPAVRRVCSSLSEVSVSIENGRDIFEFFSDMIFDALGDIPFFGSYLTEFSPLPPDISPCLVHGDLSPQNILATTGSSAYGLIDWEYSGVAYRDFDLGWYVAVSIFVGCQNLCLIDDASPNLKYFIRFGYLRLASRIIRRKRSYDLLRMLRGVQSEEVEFHQFQLDFLQQKLLET